MVPLINPYAAVQWNTVDYIMSCSHLHLIQTTFELCYEKGMRHFPVSNYDPSDPSSTYPLENAFSNVPEDALGMPNTEHSGMTNTGGHFNALGSFYASGEGVDDTWQNAMRMVIGDMWEHGGGITINHPTTISPDLVRRMINAYPNDILGIEIYNDSTIKGMGTEFGWQLELWDALLTEGYRVWGFCVIDHILEAKEGILGDGRSILLVPEATEAACAEAYRTGAFYGALKGDGIKFTKIVVDGPVISVETDDADEITFVIDGRRLVRDGNTASITVPPGTVYCRIEAKDNYERLFSQPIIYQTRQYMLERRRILMNL